MISRWEVGRGQMAWLESNTSSASDIVSVVATLGQGSGFGVFVVGDDGVRLFQ